MSRITIFLLVVFLGLISLYTVPTLANLTSGGTTELITVSSKGAQAFGESGYPLSGLPFDRNPIVAISSDGSLVAYGSYADNLVSTDTNKGQDIFVRNRTEFTTEIISVDNKGNQSSGSNYGNAHGISANNRYVVFTQQAGDLVPKDDEVDDVYVRDLQSGTVERVSESATGEPGNSHSGHPAISGDGNVVIFMSQAQNLSGPASWHQLYAVNRTEDTVTRVSVGINGEAGDFYSSWGTLSYDGNLVAFSSAASNLVLSDTNKGVDIFLRDMSANTTTLISRRIEGFPQGDAINPYITPDGAHILFTSDAALTSDSICPWWQVYVYSVAEDTIEIVSLNEQEECPTGAVFGVFGCGISADGRYAFFSSTADNYVVGDTNSRFDIFMKDRVTGVVELISQGQNGSPANGDSESCGISSDGRSIAFISEASNLIASDVGSFTDYFVYDRDVPITPTNTATPTSSPTSTPLPTASPTPTNTATATSSPTSTVLPTSSPSSTATPTTTERLLYLPLIRRDISSLR